MEFTGQARNTVREAFRTTLGARGGLLHRTARSGVRLVTYIDTTGTNEHTVVARTHRWAS